MIVCVRIVDDVRSDDVWQEILDALDAVTPLIEDVRRGIMLLDMHGAGGDFAAWSASIRTALVPYALCALRRSGAESFLRVCRFLEC